MINFVCFDGFRVGVENYEFVKYNICKDGDFMIKITDVRALPGDSAFLIDNGTTSVLYDTGFAFTGKDVCKNVENTLGDRELDYIFLTHSHYDHALGSVYVKQRYKNAIIVCGDYAKRIFEKPSARSVMRELDRKFAAKCNVSDYEDLIDSLSADLTVSDGDIINAGDMVFRAIALPGHTKCSFGFYLESEKLLLSSETLGVYVGEGDVIPSCLIGYRTTLNSIAKARQLDIEKILVPHYGLIEGDEARAYLETAKKSLIDTCRSIASILKFGGSDAEALEYFKDRFYHGKVIDAYPIDAMELNTSIMIKLIKNELL